MLNKDLTGQLQSFNIRQLGNKLW